MALKRIAHEGYGMIELTNVTFTRDGRIEAQAILPVPENDEGILYVENGMLLAVDTAKGEVAYPTENDTLIGINYASEKIYNQFTPGLKNFRVDAGLCPRIGFLTIGEVITTNTVCYDDTEFSTEEAAKAGAVYGGACENGCIKVSATKPTYGPVLKIAKWTTMPDGQTGVEFQVQ